MSEKFPGTVAFTAMAIVMALTFMRDCSVLAYRGLIHPSSEERCFSTDTTHRRVRDCLRIGRSGSECLQEARARCLADMTDLAEKKEQKP